MQNNAVKKLLNENDSYLSEITWLFDEEEVIIRNLSIETKLPLSSVKKVYMLPDYVIFIDNKAQYRFLPIRAMNSEVEKEAFLSFLKNHWLMSYL